MRTVSVFCVGTGHTLREHWTLMRALYDLTDAEGVQPKFKGELAVGKAVAPKLEEIDLAFVQPANSQHVKILFDGPDAALTANHFLTTRADAGAGFIKAFVASGGPSTICLVGHSRGAALAVMIAERLQAVSDATINLWLLDLVSRTGFVGGGFRPAIPMEQTRLVYPNVAEVVRIVMEDEAGFKLTRKLEGIEAVSFLDIFMTIDMFPLQDLKVTGPDRVVRSDHEHVKANLRTPAVKLMRMPGTHGTGTQVNPISAHGRRLAQDQNIASTRPGQLWPIGEVCLINALNDLRRWTVPLRPEGTRFVQDHVGNLLRAYGLILDLNDRARGGKRPGITLNDAVPPEDASKLSPRDPAAPYWTQEISNKQSIRSKEKLAPYGDERRWNPFVVNDQHLELLQGTYPDIASLIEVAGRTGERRLQSQPGREHHVKSALQRLHGQCNDYFGRLGAHEITIDGQPIADVAGV